MDRIAVISANFDLRLGLEAALLRHGFGVLALAGVEEAVRRLARIGAQLAILDLVQAGQPAAPIARLRRELDLPLLVLGDGGDETGCIVALETGGDDFIAAPPRPLELVARVRALLRRTRRAAPGARRYRFAGCTFDAGERRLHGPRGESLRLTLAEGRLLTAFVDAPQRVLSRERLISELHGAGETVFDRSIDMRVLRLRRRLCSLGLAAAVIRTERSLGYVLQSEVDSSAGCAV